MSYHSVFCMYIIVIQLLYDSVYWISCMVLVCNKAKLFYRHQLQFSQARPVGKHAAFIAKVCFL